MSTYICVECRPVRAHRRIARQFVLAVWFAAVLLGVKRTGEVWVELPMEDVHEVCTWGAQPAALQIQDPLGEEYAGVLDYQQAGDELTSDGNTLEDEHTEMEME